MIAQALSQVWSFRYLLREEELSRGALAVRTNMIGVAWKLLLGQMEPLSAVAVAIFMQAFGSRQVM